MSPSRDDECVLHLDVEKQILFFFLLKVGTDVKMTKNLHQKQKQLTVFTRNQRLQTIEGSSSVQRYPINCLETPNVFLSA